MYRPRLPETSKAAANYSIALCNAILHWNFKSVWLALSLLPVVRDGGILVNAMFCRGTILVCESRT